MSEINSQRRDFGFGDTRRSMHQSGSLHAIHWLALLCSGLLTLFVWYGSSQAVQGRQIVQFERKSDQVAELLVERMQKYEVALKSGAAMFEMLDYQVTHNQWRTYAHSLDLPNRYPGINGIGIIEKVTSDDRARLENVVRLQGLPAFHIHPDPNSRDESFVITYIEPMGPNIEALGLDIAFENNRLRAAESARSTGKTTITAPIVLVQDSTKAFGFLHYVPVYQRKDTALPANQWSDEERYQYFSHFIYAPFIVNNLMLGTLSTDQRLVQVKIQDGNETLYNDIDVVYSNKQDAEGKGLERVVELPMYGRNWTLTFRPSPEFYASFHSNQPLVILLVGLLVEALLFLLFILMARANRRMSMLALELGQSNSALARRTNELAASNEELESFAYIASHDLKTPLRGIQFLTELIQDSLSDSEAVEEDDIAFNVNRIAYQAKRLDNLINDVMDYCSVDNRNEALSEMSLSEELLRLRETLGLSTTELQLVSDIDVINTFETQLTQVLSNLVGNAVKHHHDRDNIRISIEAREQGDRYLFKVIDNGPGIDKRFHERIFKVFAYLSANEDSDSTGIGLAIVQKCVERNGGAVNIESAPGEGCCFTFDWPSFEAQGNTWAEAA